MASIEIDGDELVVTPTGTEKFWGWLRTLRVPLSSVVVVGAVADGRKAVRGLRAPGLHGFKRMIGTWRARHNKQYVCVQRNQPAVKVVLDGQRYRTLLIGTDHAQRVAAYVRDALPR